MSREYSQVNRTYLAYRMARAARNIQPDSPEAYRRIGETILALNVPGGQKLARDAYRYYFALGGESEDVRKALESLD